MWFYIGLTTLLVFNLCETYSSVLFYSNQFSNINQTSISSSRTQPNHVDNHHSKSPGLAVLKRLSAKSTNITRSLPKIAFDESYTNVPGFVSSSQDRNNTMVDSANTDRCIICLESLHTSIKHEIQELLDSISSLQSNSNSWTAFDNHTFITIVECNKTNINNIDEFETQESQNNHKDLLSRQRKCANKRCSAIFHKGCWEQAMKSQVENRYFDLEGEHDHIQLKCPHCNYANHNLSDTLKRMIQHKENLIRLRQQTFRLMSPTTTQSQWRRQYQSDPSDDNVTGCMNKILCCLALIPIIVIIGAGIMYMIAAIAKYT